MRRQSPARTLLRDQLRDLEQRAFTVRRTAGLSRSRSAVIEKVNEQRRRHRRGPLNPKTVGGWFQPQDPHVAPEFDDLWDLVEVYLRWAGEPADRDHWRSLHTEARSARRDRSSGEAWAALVDGHTAWRRVTPESDVTAFKQHVVRLAARLADVRDEEERGLDDPWRDPGLAERHTRRVEFLLDRVLPNETSFSPAEVALLTLIPLLHHTRTLWSMARLSRIRPADLDPAEPGEPGDRCRDKYQEFFSQYSWLVRRANQRDIPDREGARQEIGWWLFRRWLEQPAALKECPAHGFLARLDIPDEDMRELLEYERVDVLLRPPEHVIGGERTSWPEPENFVYFSATHSDQRIRERLICFLLAIARTMAFDMGELPIVIVEHLGIPDPVDLDDLRTTLTKAQWKPKGRHGIQLRAECGHPGTLEALREHSTRVDRLLRMVHRAADEDESLRQALREIRLHVSAGEVRPTRGSDGRASFSSWTTRFRVDERRARELLMGEQLYRDRALAIRELYQNALDACRFRDIRERAMSQQLGRPYAYRGAIAFTQGKDEYGRHYIECRDNGVGMGRDQLEGVFTQVGVRFTETAEFLEEQAQWADLPEPLKMYPNSRFGIGVVSYFMLADEIEVTTHRMERDGSLREPEYTVVIPGPGHFFRIKESPTAPSMGPGTCVRLYLRDGENAPSCVRELRRFLGIADFPVTAEHGTQKESWEPGRLEPRQSLPPEQNGINAHGRLLHSSKNPHVIWCEDGGGLLVDGLLVNSAKQKGVLANPYNPTGSGRLSGAIVNLTGEHAPRELSVDRSQVMDDDVADIAERLLIDAAEELATHERSLLTFPWVCAVADASPRLADILSRAMREAELIDRPMDVTRTGCFPQDAALVGVEEQKLLNAVPNTLLIRPFTGNPPDHIAVWRLLAHRPNPALDSLIALVPELAEARSVRSAFPTDTMLLVAETSSQWPTEDIWRRPGHILWTAMQVGTTPRHTASRAAEIGVSRLPAEVFSEDHAPAPMDLALLSIYLNGSYPWLDLDDVVPPGHVISAAQRLDITTKDAARRIAEFGFDVPYEGSPTGRQDDLVLLSQHCGALCPWLEHDEPIPPEQLYKASVALSVPIPEIRRRLALYGFSVDTNDLAERLDHEWLQVLSEHLNGNAPWLDHAEPVAPGHIIKAVRRTGRPFGEIIDRITAAELRVTGRFPRGLSDRELDRDLRLVSEDMDGIPPWLNAERPIPPLRLMRASRVLGMSIPDVIQRLGAYGFQVPGPDELPEWPVDREPELLSVDLDGSPSWLDVEQPVPLYQLIRAERTLGIPILDAAARLRDLGMNVPDVPAMIRAALTKVPTL